MGLCTIEAKTPIGSKLVFEKRINVNWRITNARAVVGSQVHHDAEWNITKRAIKTFLRCIEKLLKTLRLNLATCAILLRTTKRNS